MKQLFVKAFRLILWDWSTILIFELLYKFFLVLVAPYYELLLEQALKVAGLNYLTVQNMTQLFTHPVAIVYLFLLFLLFLLYVYVEITAIIIYCQHGITRRKIGPLKLMVQAVRKAVIIMWPRNVLLMLFVAVIIPLTGFSLSAGPLIIVKVPGFILDYIHGKPLLNIVYKGIIFFLLILVFRWIFSLHETILKGVSFREACRTSSSMLKGKWLITLWYFIVWSFFLWLIAAAIYYIGIFLILAVVKFSFVGEEAQAQFWYYFSTMDYIGRIAFGMLCAIGNLALISVLYYSQHHVVLRNKNKWTRKALFLGTCKAVVITLLFLFYAEFTPNYESRIFSGTRSQIEIVAHRAGALFAPENTISALEQSIESGADYAEVDVQQTKDGQLILLHDTNFQRTTGVNRNVWDVTLKQTQSYETGMGNRFQNEKIPTLEQAVSFSKNKIKLMIELKSNGREYDLVGRTLKIIEKYNFENQCIIASMNHELLEQVKRKNPNIQTAYISAIAYGDFESLHSADIYSIETTFISRELIKRLESIGKPLYVWTVNEEEDMREVAEKPIKGIITDNPYLAQYVLENENPYLLLNELIYRVLGESDA